MPQKRKEGGLEARLSSIESRLSKLEAPRLVRCAFCEGGGKELDKEGNPAIGDDGLPIPCRVCGGAGKVKIG